MRCIPFGLIVTNVVIIACVVIQIMNSFFPLLEHSPIVGVIMSLFFLVFLILCFASNFMCVMCDCGPLPESITAVQVELYTKEELTKYAAMEPQQPEASLEGELQAGADERHVVDDAEVNANQLAADRIQERMENSPESPTDVPSRPLSLMQSESEYSPVQPADHPDVTDERRRRKERRGLQVLSVPQVARGILEAMEVGGETKRRELARLFDTVELCPYCQVYLLQRTYHCRHCDRCVHFASHHCCSLGQCVGYGNHKYYFLFLFYLMLSAITADLAGLLCLLNNWNFFVSLVDTNLKYYIVFNLSLSFSIIVFPYLLKHMHTVGCGESMIMQMKRERQEMIREARRESGGRVFSALPQEDVPEKQAFDWANVRRVFGEESKLFRYLLPVEPKTNYNAKEASFSELKDLISVRLHCLADIVPDEPLPE